MPFSITPLANIPPPNAEEFPSFMQLQSDGTDLGLPDADTINFGTGLTATRGVGENSNVVTVTSDGVVGTLQVQEDGVNLGAANVDTLNFSTGILATRGSDNTVTLTVEGAASSTGLLLLESPPDPPGSIFQFNATAYIDWTGTVLAASSDWEWDSDIQLIRFLNAGTYRLIITAFVQAVDEWPGGNTTYGSAVDEAPVSLQARTHTDGDTNDSASRVTWTDQTFITTDADVTFSFGVYALATNNAHGVNFAGMTVAIDKLA